MNRIVDKANIPNGMFCFFIHFYRSSEFFSLLFSYIKIGGVVMEEQGRIQVRFQSQRDSRLEKMGEVLPGFNTEKGTSFAIVVVIKIWKTLQ